MKDKRTYTNKKEHGEDMSHENESKIDTTPIQLLTEQYRADLWEYKKRESLYVETQNKLKGTKQIVLDMSSTIRELKIQNDNGYGYQLLCPPARCQHANLSEGGNHGRFDWSRTEKGATLSLQYTSGGLPQAETAQKDFLHFLQTVQDTAFEKLFNTVPALKQKAMKKAKLVAKDKTESELESLALKLHMKGAKSPLKMNPDGTYHFQVKCGAFIDRDGTYVPRRVNLYDQKYNPITEETTVLSGAVVGPIMTIRLYVTPGYATYGVTYQLSDRHMVLYRQGTGSQKVDSATLDKGIPVIEETTFLTSSSVILI